MIIGFTGKNGSGKTEAVRFLEECGYISYSLSDAIRFEIQKQNQKPTRENLIATGTRLRAEQGPSVLADVLFEKMDIDKNYAIDSIRNPAEVRSLKRRKDFYLFEIVADQKLRFERCQKRDRAGDAKDLENFVALEEKELKSEDPAKQQLLATAELADVVVKNNGSLEDFQNLIKKEVLKLLALQTRPSWDEYFMNIARVASLRSNCMKRKVAAVIVKDNRVVSTGYNGTPRGIQNCNEGGCPRCNDLAPSGQALGECLCSHAEENAIVQAAYHGVSVKEATLYTTFSPCLICTKMILNSGIKEVVYNAAYPMGELPLKLLKEAGVVTRNVASS